jgi:hypothetical protein
MKYELKYDKERNLITGYIYGEFDSSLVTKMSSDLMDMMQKYDCNRLLNDLRSAKITPETLDIYVMPKKVAQSREAIRCKRALVVNGPLKDYHFLETVSVNLGQQLKIFTDIDPAIDWLIGHD